MDEPTLAALDDQLERAAAHDLCGDLAPVDSEAEFRELPFPTGEELKADYDAHAPEGSLFTVITMSRRGHVRSPRNRSAAPPNSASRADDERSRPSSLSYSAPYGWGMLG